MLKKQKKYKKVNLVEISKIKTRKSLKKYSLNEPIFLNNYLFHYLILSNNLKGLKLTKYPIYKLNEEGYNGFMLAAKNKNYDILNYLIKTYSDYVFNLNLQNENFLHLLHPSDNEYLDFIIKNDLNWNELMIQKSKDDTSPLETLLTDGNYNIINKILNKYDFKWNNYVYTPYHFSLFFNRKINTDTMLKLIKLIENKVPNYYNLLDKRRGMNLIYPALTTQNIKIIKYIGDKVEMDYFTPLNTYHTFQTAYVNDMSKDDYTISSYIWNKIKTNHNFTATNKFGDNLAHFIISKRFEESSGSYKLEADILSKCDTWNIQNIEKSTPLHYLVNLDFKKYSKFLKGKKVNLKIKDENDETVLDISSKSWKIFLLKLPKEKADKQNIKIKNYKYKHGNIFQAKFTDMGIFAIEINKKYPQLYLPKYIINHVSNVNSDNGLDVPDEILEEYLNFPWVVIWNKDTNYWIHPNLNQLINNTRRDKTHDFASIFLSTKLPSGGLHAGLLLYDFKNNTVERFDPYGNTSMIDDNIDEILEEELTWNTGLTYLKPLDYMPTSGFQTISNEENNFNKKMGDFGGFCLAWCLWYLELRLNNPKVKSKILVKKSIKKLKLKNITFSEHIRNYANDINEKRIKWLTSVGIDKKRTSDEIITNQEESLIIDQLIEQTTLEFK
jgi:hypothetical protein